MKKFWEFLKDSAVLFAFVLSAIIGISIYLPLYGDGEYEFNSMYSKHKETVLEYNQMIKEIEAGVKAEPVQVDRLLELTKGIDESSMEILRTYDSAKLLDYLKTVDAGNVTNLNRLEIASMIDGSNRLPLMPVDFEGTISAVEFLVVLVSLVMLMLISTGVFYVLFVMIAENRLEKLNSDNELNIVG